MHDYLVALVSLAYAFCASFGLYYHQKVQPIKIKNHGYKATSFARYGLDQVRTTLRSTTSKPVPSWPLLRQLFKWLKRQLAQNQLTILGSPKVVMIDCNESPQIEFICLSIFLENDRLRRTSLEQRWSNVQKNRST